MITKDCFIKIVDGLRDYWDAYSKFEDALGIYVEQNFLTDIFDTVMDALVKELEVDIDDDIGPLLYCYAFECDWGRNEITEEGVGIFDIEPKPLLTAADLYDYLMLKRNTQTLQPPYTVCGSYVKRKDDVDA